MALENKKVPWAKQWVGTDRCAPGTEQTSTRGFRIKLDRGQTREICEKQEKYFKGKVIVFTIQRLILYQYSVNLLTYLELY